MVDAGIKQIRINKSEFPLVQFTTTKVAATISNISGNGTTVTYTTYSPHNFLPGERVSIVGALPTAYNLTRVAIAAVPNTTSFTVLNSVSGAYVSGGIVEIYSTYDTVNSIYLIRDYVEDLHYDFRYRVVSEDRNRFSHWSEIVRYPMPDVTTPFPFNEINRFSISKPSGANAINAVWSFPGDAEDPSDYVKFFRDTAQYDVWLRWNNNNITDLNDAGWSQWEWSATVSSNNFSIQKRDDDVKRIEIAIQIPTTIKIRDYYNNKLTLFRGLSGTI
jgi:hypothetical protein